MNIRMPPDWIWRLVIFLFAIGVLVTITTRWESWSTEAGTQTTDDAYLQSDLTPVAAHVAGYVRDLPVQDFERVKKGQLLVQLQDDDYRAQVDALAAAVQAADAQIATARAQRALQEANIAAAQAALGVISANLEQNARDLTRQQRLLSTGSSSTEAGEKLHTTNETLKAQEGQARAQLEAARRQLGVLDAQRAQAEAARAEKQASLALARVSLAYTRIVAPDDGVIGQRQVKPGQFVPAGGQVTALIPLPRVWVMANFKETQLTRMRVGAQARLRLDTYPGHRLKGHVIAFAPGSGAQFALLPPDNATGNFTKVVQRVAVKIAVDDADGLGDLLRPGLSVVATVDTPKAQ